MHKYILRRLFQSLIVLIILSMGCYYLMSLMPGDPVDLLIQSNPHVTSADIAKLRELYGLDKPVYYRYWNWLSDFVTGDFGYSRTYRIPVTELLGPRLINTFILALSAFFVAVTVGILIGVLSALKPGSKFDYAVNFMAFTGVSMPSFFIAILLILFFAVMLPWFPAGGTFTIGAEFQGMNGMVLDRIKYLVLPVLSLTVLQMASYARYSRSAMIDTMNNDFIRTAHAKGLKKNVVIFKHGFRNALIPIITIVALNASGLLSGAIITETVFAYQGVGKLILDAILSNDFNVAMVSFMITVAMVSVMNLVADILYAVVDPRITYS